MPLGRLLRVPLLECIELGCYYKVVFVIIILVERVWGRGGGGGGGGRSRGADGEADDSQENT